jgi:hypothetical protein
MPVHGSALSFDGQDDYVMVADDASLDLQNSFTIAAWIYLEDYMGWASLVTKGDKPNINNYAIQQSEPYDPIYRTEFGRLRFSGCAAHSGPLPESQTVLSLKTWHFVVVTFDGLQVRFYTDGHPDGSGAVQGPLCTNDQPLYIGVDFPLTTEYWHGAIDELRIWNTTLSDSEIQETMNGSPASSDGSHSSIPFSNSLRASTSSLDKVTPFPIFVPSADQSRRSYFGSRSFQLTRFSSFAQPDPAFDTTPIFFTISYLISAIEQLS